MSKMGQWVLEMQEAHTENKCFEDCQECKNFEFEFGESL